MGSQRHLRSHHGASPHLAEHPKKAMDNLPWAVTSFTELLLSAGCSLGTMITFNPHDSAAGRYQYPPAHFTDEETEAQAGLSNLAKATQYVNARVRLHTQSSNL